MLSLEARSEDEMVVRTWPFDGTSLLRSTPFVSPVVKVVGRTLSDPWNLIGLKRANAAVFLCVFFTGTVYRCRGRVSQMRLLKYKHRKRNEEAICGAALFPGTIILTNGTPRPIITFRPAAAIV